MGVTGPDILGLVLDLVISVRSLLSWSVFLVQIVSWPNCFFFPGSLSLVVSVNLQQI